MKITKISYFVHFCAVTLVFCLFLYYNTNDASLCSKTDDYEKRKSGTGLFLTSIYGKGGET